MTTPPLMPPGNYGGDWPTCEDALHGVFERDIIQHDLQFRGVPIRARPVPEHERKWACFRHLISEGRVEDDRIPDMRRCERLPLVLWIIENADAVANIDIREQARRRERNRMLWPDAMV